MHNNTQQIIVPADTLNQWIEAKKTLDLAKNSFNTINKIVQELTKNTFEHLLQEEGKEDGQRTVMLGDFKVTGGIKQTSKWDQKSLTTIAQSISPELYNNTFDMKLDVPKSKFNKLTDADLRARLENARIVTFATITPKIEVVTNEA